MRRLYSILLKALMEVVKPEGLISLDAPVLASIADAPGIDIRKLAERLAVDLAKVKRIVRKLQQRGLIEQAPDAGGKRSWA